MPEILRLPLGGGIDRYPGVMETRPGDLHDLVNMVPEGLKLRVRRGTRWTAQFPDREDAEGNEACSCPTHVVCIQAVQTTTEGLAVVYHDDTRQVHVYRISGAGFDPVHVGHWFTLDGDADAPPVIVGAESYGRAFLAHDERRVGKRAVTQVYDAIAGTMDDLEADLNGEGDAPVRFRGVMSWLAYMIGWGYGSPDDERPEIVRVSKPSEPNVFLKDSYWVAGDRAGPVTACVQAGGQLLIMKATETFRVIGTHALNFGIVPQYSIQGCLGSRLAMTVDNIAYLWGIRGPWRTTGGQADDLAPPLELPEPQVPDPSRGFAVYIPGEEVVEWHFEKDVYALVLKDGRAAWSTRTRPVQMSSGGFLYSHGNLSDPKGVPPTGHPAIVGVELMLLTWRNVDADADELCEVWVKLPGEEWAIEPPDVDVTTADTQSRSVTLVPAQPYELAVRYRRDGRYHPSYRGSPDTWPAQSRTSGVAGVDPGDVPAISRATWSRVSPLAEQVVVEFTTPAPNLGHRLFRNGEQLIDLEAGRLLGIDTRPNGEEWAIYEVAAIATGELGEKSEEVRAWSGPPAPIHPNWVRISTGSPTNPLGDRYLVSWAVPEPLAVQVRADRGLVVDAPAGQLNANIHSGQRPFIEVRTVVVTHGVADYSDWIVAESVSITS